MFYYIKAVHIIGVVSWFAGLFYLIRLFIYHIEAFDKVEKEKEILHKQFTVMENRLWKIITLPSSIITLLSGLYMLHINPAFVKEPWMIAKLSFVFLLFVYQFKSVSIMKKLQTGMPVWSSTKLRLWNEVATLILVAVVFLVVVKTMLSMLWGVVGLVFLGVVMMIFVKVYKANRERK